PRKMLENELRRLKIADPKHLLDSPENAMVLVHGLIMPGSRRGDLFDVEVALPPGSKVTSLRGGMLQECYLRLDDHKSNLDPNYNKPDGGSVLAGHQVARASGHLMVGLDHAAGQEPNQLSGVVWEGGMSFIDRPYHFMLKEKKQKASVADAVAHR